MFSMGLPTGRHDTADIAISSTPLQHHLADATIDETTFDNAAMLMRHTAKSQYAIP